MKAQSTNGLARVQDAPTTPNRVAALVRNAWPDYSEISGRFAPKYAIDQARRIVLSYIEEFSPTIVGIEKPLLMPTKRAALVSVISQELHARSRDFGTRVIEISAREVRRIVLGNPHAKKFEVARFLVRSFPDLAPKLPKDPPHPVLGYKPKDRYWLHMFDALAVAAREVAESG